MYVPSSIKLGSPALYLQSQRWCVDLIEYWLDLLNCAFYLRLEMHTSIGLSASCKILITNTDLRMDFISRVARSTSEWGFVSLSRKSSLFLYIRGGSRVYMLCNLIVFCICGESLHTMLPIIEELQANPRPISNETPRYILGMSSVECATQTHSG